MSFAPFEWAQRVICKSGNDKSVLWAIVARAQKKDNGFYEAFPGIDTIAKEACVTEQSVYNALNRLYASGLITKIPPDGKRKSNTYRLNVDAPNTEQNADDAKTTRPTSSGPRDHGGTGQSRTIQSHPASHEQRPDPYRPSIRGDAGWASDPIPHHRAAG